jgi:hypothetical protein
METLHYYCKLLSEQKCKYAEGRVTSHKKTVEFWLEREAEFKAKYGENPSKAECKHIHVIKQYRKKAQAELEYWEKELEKLG